MTSSHLRHAFSRPDRAEGLSERTLLDVRGAEEFAAGHLKGAVNLPVQELAARLTELGPKDRPVAVYCRSGRRSAVATQLLRDAGFSSATDLGGLIDTRTIG
jgi:phage shock protein E